MSFLISFLILLLGNGILHEFHLSNTEVRYNIEESALQITSRIFIDDLEMTLANYGFDNLYICTEKEAESAEGLIAQYLKNNLVISVDDKVMEFEFLGKEISDDLIAVWCYLEILDVSPKEKIEIENNTLLETFDDQKNIVRIKMDSGQRAMFILKKGENKGVLEL